MTTLFVKYELPTIQAFFPPEKREKFVQLLGNANRRRDALKVLHHEITLDPKWSSPVGSGSDILELLRARGGGPRAYLIGTSRDQSVLPLEEAVECLGKEAGILVCTPGQLAYYSGRNGKRRFILERGTLVRTS